MARKSTKIDVKNPSVYKAIDELIFLSIFEKSSCFSAQVNVENVRYINLPYIFDRADSQDVCLDNHELRCFRDLVRLTCPKDSMLEALVLLNTIHVKGFFPYMPLTYTGQITIYIRYMSELDMSVYDKNAIKPKRNVSIKQFLKNITKILSDGYIATMDNSTDGCRIDIN